MSITFDGTFFRHILFGICLFFCLFSSGAPVPDKDPLRTKARSGDIPSILRLAEEYFYGTPQRKRDPVLALYWYRTAAEKGNPDGMFNYGVCLERKECGKPNVHEAMQWYRKAAENGSMIARYNLAMLELSGIPADPDRSLPAVPRNMEASRINLVHLAEQHYPPALLLLAKLILRSRHPDRASARKAVEMLEEVVRSPSPPPEAFRMLADCKYAGLGTPVDLEGMLSLLRKAVKAGDAEAAAKLAYCHEYGRGTEPNPAKARKLYELAAEWEHPLARYRVAEFLLRESPPDTVKARKLLEVSAKQGCRQAMFRLGVLYCDGKIFPKDETRSRHLFMEAAQRGYAPAMYNLACLFAAGGKEFRKDEESASFWFRAGADAGDAASARAYGLRCLKGTGTKRSLTLGEKYLRQAAEAGDAEAREALMRMRVL